MKSILIAALIGICAITTAQEDYIAALQSGDAQALGKHLDNEVELCIFDREDIFDRSKAIVELERFFTNHKVKGFKKIHQGESKGSASYTIGELATDSGKYRVYTYYNQDNGEKRIVELRIDRS